MSYFPAFLSLDNKKILIVGGGAIAYEKLEHLLDFTTSISLIALDFNDKMQEAIAINALEFQRREYRQGDIAGFDVVIVAVDDIPLQEAIFRESKNYRCLCNAVDSTDYCDFIFPSYIKNGDLTIAVSTSGASPAMAKQLRVYIQKLIPNDIGEFLKEMRQLRVTIPKGKERMKMLEERVKNYIENWSKR